MLFGLFGNKEKEITPDQIEILFHTEAAYFGEHGRIIATNKELGIVEKPIIFCLKGFSTPLPLNHRMFAHIWNSALAEGWIPIEVIKYGSVIEKHAEDGVEQPQQGRRQVTLKLADNATHAEALAHVEGVTAAVRQGFPIKGDFAGTEVPAYLRKEQQEGTGFKSAGFDAASPVAG